MKLLVQPGDGVMPLVTAINDAKSTVEILIFRFDRQEIEKALVSAVARGVDVRALIAYTNRGGEKSLRALEMRLLGAGITVARTADDLVRYHAKMMIIDGKVLYLLSFNFTRIDIERSRSFAIITDDRAIVQEAATLFEADSKRHPYTAGLDTFVVSPANSRKQLSDFIKGAKKQLLIYDPEVADPAIIRLLQDRSKAGVEIRILGRISPKTAKLDAKKLFMRLHTRMIVRDGEDTFLGSQSLRTAELDARREVGLIFQEPKITARLIETFESDWIESQKAKSVDQDTETDDEPPSSDKVGKKVAKAVVKDFPPVSPFLEVVVREMAGPKINVDVNQRELEDTVKEAVRNAIKDAVSDAVEQATPESE
jgi:phosphatidylserine/phosphatidylglycerophosphate/cardiolipin synthase-like enzyme